MCMAAMSLALDQDTGVRGDSSTQRYRHPDQRAAERNHGKPHHRWVESGAAAEDEAAEEQHHDRDGIRRTQRQPRITDEQERDDDGESRQEAEQTNPERAEPIGRTPANDPAAKRSDQRHKNRQWI